MSTLSERPIAATIVAQASHWLMLHWDGALEGNQRAGFDAWYAADPEHQRAWQRLQQLQATLAGVPADTALGILRDLPDQRRRRTLQLLGLLLVTGASGYLGERWLPWRETLADLRSGTGERLPRQLPDGSQLLLNSGSAVDIRFSATERRIRLYRGEILLTSGSDPGQPYRPLIVETAAGDIQALGTRFAVYEVDGGSRVDLYLGALAIRPRHAPALRLEAGQRVWFDADRSSPTGPADNNAIAWRDGRLIAERMPLGRFLSELARYRPGILRCAPQVADLPLTGVFPLDDSDRVLLALEQSLPVRVERVTRYWVTVSPRG